MVDPITQQETPYAFSGDPVAQTGWLDIQRDVRNMISCGPFRLDRGDTVSLTVVWVVERDRSLEAAMARMKAQIDQIRGASFLWAF